MQEAMCSKDREKCTELLKISHITTKKLQNEFRQFSTHCSENLELCHFLEILLDLTIRLKHLIVGQREQLGGSFNGCSESSPSVQVYRQYPLPQICIVVFRKNADPSNRTPRDLTTLYGRQVCCANIAR